MKEDAKIRDTFTDVIWNEMEAFLSANEEIEAFKNGGAKMAMLPNGIKTKQAFETLKKSILDTEKICLAAEAKSRRETRLMRAILIALVGLGLLFAATVHAEDTGNWVNDWAINGVPANRLSWERAGDIALGVAASTAVHWLGHVVVLEASNTSWGQIGTHEHLDERVSDDRAAWIGRAGYLADLAVGTALHFSRWRKSDFTLGYHAHSAGMILAYPMVFKYGDLDLIERNAESGLEWFIYSGYSTLLLTDHLN
jgi:hypothetical protein